MTKNSEWLALTTEQTLEPDLPICDPHHHLWLNQPARVVPRYGFDEILADVQSGHNIVSTVFIECAAMYKAEGPKALKPIGETEFVSGIAAISASGDYGPTRIAAGIVGSVDLTLGTRVGPVLEAHIKAGGGRFRGIRHGVSWDACTELPDIRTKPGPQLLLNPVYQTGVGELEKFDLSLDVWCYHPQIPELTNLARNQPGVTIILNHFGIPLGVGPYAGHGDDIFTKWKSDITELAKCENVMAKLGGLHMPENGFNWHLQPKPPTSEQIMQTTRHYYDFMIDAFGIDRCMFESNFPVDSISCSYNILWNSFKRYSAGFSADEKSRLFHDTATRVYRI